MPVTKMTTLTARLCANEGACARASIKIDFVVVVRVMARGTQ